MVLHRSQNRLIYQGDNKRTENPEHERGWLSPREKPYRPVGVFQKVVPIIEELKSELDNCVEYRTETQKNINAIKRNQDNIYVEGEDATRTWNSIAAGIV